MVSYASVKPVQEYINCPYLYKIAFSFSYSKLALSETVLGETIHLCGLVIQNGKELYKITETTILEDSQNQQQLKWISRKTHRENNIMKLLTFHTTSNKI